MADGVVYSCYLFWNLIFKIVRVLYFYGPVFSYSSIFGATLKKNIKQPLGIPKRSFLGGRGAQPHSIAFGAVFCWIRSTYPHCAFPNVSSKCLRQGMHIYIGCIYLNFLYFWSRGSSHIDCICFTFLHCVFLNVSSKNLCGRLRSHIECTCLIFLYCVFSNVASNCLPESMQSHTGCICLFFHCAF